MKLKKKTIFGQNYIFPQPLSVHKEAIHSPVDEDGNIEPRRQQRPLNNSLHTTISNLTPLSWRNRRQPSPRNDHNHDHDDGNDSKKELGEEVTMRVAVTIALPSPEYPIHIKNNNGQETGKNNMDRQHMTDYCIGTYECPWH